MEPDARERWNKRYCERGPLSGGPSSFLLEIADRLPAPGRVLDVAGGSGRNALWLAQAGWDVTILDIAAEGLALVHSRAAAAGVRIRTIERDLEADGLPSGTWDLVISFHYLHRPLFAAWARALVPGGMLVFEQPTVRNLERHAHPSERFCLHEGELPGLVPADLQVVHYEEGWNEAGRHEARLVARRPRLEKDVGAGGPD